MADQSSNLTEEAQSLARVPIFKRLEPHELEHQQVSVALDRRQMLPGADDDFRDARLVRVRQHRTEQGIRCFSSFHWF